MESKRFGWDWNFSPSNSSSCTRFECYACGEKKPRLNARNQFDRQSKGRMDIKDGEELDQDMHEV